MSDAIVIGIGVIGAIVGISVVIWSTIDTRRKYGGNKRSAEER